MDDLGKRVETLEQKTDDHGKQLTELTMFVKANHEDNKTTNRLLEQWIEVMKPWADLGTSLQTFEKIVRWIVAPAMLIGTVLGIVEYFK